MFLVWELYQLPLPLPQPDLPPRYNVAPTRNIVVVRMARDASLREMTEARWGLVPGWAKDVSIGNRIINARAETIAEKPALRSAFRLRRCLIPASGFYEWVREGDAKVPFYIYPRDGAPITFAGLWEHWTAPDGSPLESCCIVTTAANALMSPLHHRMPVILEPECFEVWLNADDSRLAAVHALMQPRPWPEMAVRRVSTSVNNARNDHPSLIEPAEPAVGTTQMPLVT